MKQRSSSRVVATGFGSSLLRRFSSRGHRSAGSGGAEQNWRRCSASSLSISVLCFGPKKKPTSSNDGTGDGSGTSERPRPQAGAGGGEQGAAGGLPEFEGVHKFTIDELSDATEKYANWNYIGEGSSGTVYKGCLKSGEVSLCFCFILTRREMWPRQFCVMLVSILKCFRFLPYIQWLKALEIFAAQTVAIKMLDGWNKGVHGAKAFITEVSILSKTDHPNIVKMLGICTERDEMLLVYEYMPRGNLAECVYDLHDRKETLDWNTRVKIATETARGLLYLHETSNPQIIHRDLKPTNILLDNEFNTKLGDFGIAKFAPVRGEVFATETNIGTFGYSCPEYLEFGRLSERSDIYSFGVILLELLTGRAAKAPGKPFLVQWVASVCTLYSDSFFLVSLMLLVSLSLSLQSRNFLDDPDKVTQLADPSLEGRYPEHQFIRLAEIASRCTVNNQDARPSIRDVIAALEDVASQPYNVPEGGDVPSSSAPTT
ncbi:hypothetical protein Taro_005462 [Colocasia esculenta]|uniref:Protein kinase domain-containing protein n=1 Tax=Colocasia esculenta TaxID=4460 RepID=A0A843TPV6_COLES|nr:hypothetical protein [Colocasia esculenta]